MWLRRKKRFVSLDESKIMAHLGLADYQNSCSRNTTIDLSIEFSCASRNCSIEALMEKIRLVVTEKYDFEYQDKSLIKRRFDFWDYRNFEAKKNMTELFFKSRSHNINSLIETFMIKLNPLIGKNEYDYRGISILSALFGISD